MGCQSVVGMQGDGPLSGVPVDLGVLLASDDAVALDLAICKMLGIEPVGIPPLRQAKVRGLWPANIEYSGLFPRDVEYRNFILPSTSGYLLTGIRMPQRSPVPTNRCTGCGLCDEICPRNAIKLNNGMAQVDYTICIRCYCCHEICPENAIKLGVAK